MWDNKVWSFRIIGFLLFVFIVNTNATSSDKVDPLVTVEQGKLRGAVRNLLDGSPYFSFKGIPYAKPPIGNLRFKAPEPPQPWEGIYDAVNHGPVCPQFDFTTNEYIEGNESCLFLNVYTKNLNPHSKIPVMVFIHGGAYMSGAGDAEASFGPEFLLQHNVILVTLNYRLEVLGFLSLDTAEVPGNAGMKDQVAALRWVKKNIRKFGGDPHKVTIFGESAGSTSVTYLMQSPMAKGLFQKVIAESGVSIIDWAIGRDAKERAFRVGKELGKETNDTKELLEFLRTVPAVKLAGLTFKTMTFDEQHRGLKMHFVPVVEKKFKHVEAFLTEEPIDILLKKKMNDVPLMIGYNSAEGLIMLDDQLAEANFSNKNPGYFVPREIVQKVTKDKVDELGQRIKRFYFGNEDISADKSSALVNMMTDIHFIYSTHRFVHFYSLTQEPLYMYRFNLDTDLNVVKNLSGLSHMKGAAHADELYYLFYSSYNQAPYESQDKLKQIVFRVTKLWTDFAITGNPTPGNCDVTWPLYKTSTKDYLDLSEQFTPGRFAEKDRVEFWNNIYCEVGLPCIAK